MKKLTIISILIFFVCNTFCQKAQISIRHITENFYVHTSYKNLNNYLYPSNGLFAITDSGAILIDTPWDEDQTQQLVDKIKKDFKKEIILCIVTHSHDDRTAGLDILKKIGIKTYSSILTRNISLEKHEKTAEYYFLNDTTFTINNVSFQTFYPGEGHTKDNIVIWFPCKKVLFGGCLVKSHDATDLGNIKEANIEQWPNSINNVINHYPKIKHVIPGHQKWGNKKLLSHTLKLLK
jgi:metallo-beta-lactamase class B